MIYETLRQALPDAGCTLASHPRRKDEDTILLRPSFVRRAAEILHAHYPFLMDVCGVDYPERDKRFEVVYHFYNPEQNQRLRLKALVGEGEMVPSLTPVYRAADWFERECYDLFGIKFEGHPNLRRILCHEDFVGHPLRKDYPADRNQELLTPIHHTFEREHDLMTGRQQGQGGLDHDHLDERTWINIGPAHPATHGTLRFMAVLKGETLEKVDVEIGYLHRCFEKMCESHTYNQIIPYTDRLNYCSAPINNNAWCLAVEKMLGIVVPPRAQVMRLILDEFSRIIDHIVCTCTNAVDLGALTNFWLGFQGRERVYDLFEKLCGARLTVSLARVGGMGFDFPDGWIAQARETVGVLRQARREIDKLLTKNRIFVHRMVGAGPISREDAINWGFTGPCLRAAGEPMDLRKASPYSMYDQFDFDVPIGSRGDSYDRYMVRMEEIEQSCRILDQALANVPEGPLSVDDPKIRLPAKHDVYDNIEGLMNHFMLVIHGVQPPPGEIYSAVEGANGELGFYIVSDGTGRPYRVKCRPPCFAVFQGFSHMVEGGMIADAIAALGSVNIIAGELDR